MTQAASVTSPQARVLALANKPTPNLKVSQARVLAPSKELADVEVSQARVFAVAKGRVAYPHIRAWTFTLDGHDYYVLRLGTQSTLVYDVATEQWYVWGSQLGDLWFAYNGCNWAGANSHAGGYGSNVVVGDDTFGVLYFLDPEYDYDDSADIAGLPSTFERVVQSQTLVKSYNGDQCFSLQVLGSVGNLYDGSQTTVSLTYSDDRGVTYTSAGTLQTPSGDYSTRLSWRSLGVMQVPGRLFKITDYGALKRIDSIDMEDGQ
jgi:hypothetical protein